MAKRQLDADLAKQETSGGSTGTGGGWAKAGGGGGSGILVTPAQPTRVMRQFHGTVEVNSLPVGLDASKIAEEVIAHLVGRAGSEVTVTI